MDQLATNQKQVELRAGIFVLVGLFLIGGMVLYFGGLQEKLDSTYDLKISFPNASGLVKNSLVYMAGAPIGRVSSTPHIVDEGQGVAIDVRIRKGIKIREGSRWIIGSSGLLGDRYVDVVPISNSERPFLKSGEEIRGSRTPNIADIAQTVEPLINEAEEVAKELKEIAHKLNQKFLTEENSEHFAQLLIQLEDIFFKINQGLDKGDIEGMMEDLRNIVRNLNKLFRRAGAGSGILYEVMADPKTGDHLAAFIANLRKHGVLFYSDTYDEDSSKQKTSKRMKTPRDRR